MGIYTEKFLINGPSGAIEVLVEEPADKKSAGWGIVLHPHPLMGGSMTHKVPYILSRALLDMGYCSVRFNFRGVGQSCGHYDDGHGEIDDALCVKKWCDDRYSDTGKTALFSFSFGSFVGAHLANSCSFDHIVLSGLPVSRFDCPTVPSHSIVIHGELDELIPLESVYLWAEPQSIPVVVFPRTSHFFDRKLIALKDFILLVICPTLSCR
ncbi:MULTISPECIES: alpha/beta hydrolase [Candidatus Ichthyocystis]|uniref:Putative alpha/beta hydrolase family protein n=1 Tax=Candidatus Ichthyocystis hellenicum TaxID=1561003 RepID=A0A0S4M7Y6_9BURK|nr:MULTISPECIES: CocE/NonD family hydrolase [Ichthyocystis]CUT17492.1 putative alpha/beta hydrolase family protein [Candidatus Ichthyocystis hellenicum]